MRKSRKVAKSKKQKLEHDDIVCIEVKPNTRSIKRKKPKQSKRKYKKTAASSSSRFDFPSNSNDAVLVLLLTKIIKDMKSIQEVQDAIGIYEEEHGGEKIQKLAMTSPRLQRILTDLSTEKEQKNIKKNERKMQNRILSLADDNPENHNVVKADTSDGKSFFLL